MNDVMFFILAAIILISGLLVVTLRNLVHSALFMILTFLGVAAIYIALGADFLAAVQVLVYAGAIAIFIVFGIMLTQRGNMKQTNLFSKNVGLAAVVSVAFLGTIHYIISKTPWPVSNAAAPAKTVEPIAELMLNKYVVPFEVAAILLTVAMIGAIIIAKEVKKQ